MLNTENQVGLVNYMLTHLINIHRNLGHPSNKLLQCILREAGATPEVIKEAGELECPLCAKFRSTVPARPGSVMHAKEFNETLCMDVSYTDICDTEQALILHVVDEASRYHVADVIKTGKPNQLGNISQEQLIRSYQNSWVR